MNFEDQKFMEDFFNNNIQNNNNINNEEEDNKSEVSYNSDNNEYNFEELINEKENNKDNDKEKIIEIKENKNIECKFKKIEQIEKLLNKYNLTEDGLLLLKDLPKFEELTDEQKFYEMKKTKYKLYKNCNFNFANYAKNNKNGLFFSGDGKLKNQRKNNNRKKRMQNIQMQNHNFINLNKNRMMKK